MRTTPTPIAPYVKIGEGCNNGCSFLHHSRSGKLYSRPIESIVAEVQQLAADGVKEINLIVRIRISYGVDIAGRSAYGSPAPIGSHRRIRWIRLFISIPITLQMN